MPDKKTVVLYHANCHDGFGGAFAAWKKFGDAADYVPMRYGMAIPDDVDELQPDSSARRLTFGCASKSLPPVT